MDEYKVEAMSLAVHAAGPDWDAEDIVDAARQFEAYLRAPVVVEPDRVYYCDHDGEPDAWFYYSFPIGQGHCYVAPGKTRRAERRDGFKSPADLVRRYSWYSEVLASEVPDCVHEAIKEADKA